MPNGGRSHPLTQLTITRLQEFYREPEAIFWVFAFPLIVACALGLAFRGGGQEDVRIAVTETAGAAPLAAALQNAAGVSVQLMAPERANLALRYGDVHLVVVPGTPPIYRFDPTRTESRLARIAVNDALQRAAGRIERWRAQEQEVVAPGARYIDWLVPGLLGMNIMGTGLWMVGFSIVQARTRKLLKRLIATPMRRVHYLLAYMLSRLVFLGLEVAVLLGFASLMFSVPVRGSVMALAVVASVGALSFGGLGLLIASRAQTVEGINGLLNLFMAPMWILSGVFFSSARFPEAVQPFIRALPLTALNDALRAVMIDGKGMFVVMPQLGVLSVWGLSAFAVALKIFRWR